MLDMVVPFEEALPWVCHIIHIGWDIIMRVDFNSFGAK